MRKLGATHRTIIVLSLLVDKLSPSVVLDTNAECGGQLQNMIVEVDKPFHQQDTLISEEPIQVTIVEHKRHNTNCKRRARHGPNNMQPGSSGFAKSRKKTSNDLSQTLLCEKANLMELAKPPKKI